MRSVNVNRDRLIDAIKINKTRHAEDVTAAREAYRTAMQMALVDALKQLESGEFDGIHKMINALDKPEDHTRDYERALLMLDMSQDAIIELTEAEFRQFVQDEWGWKGAWTAMNAKYLSHP
jgi:hypothetical protein